MRQPSFVALVARPVFALAFALALAGCNQDGVCTDGNYCTAFVKKSNCKGEWHKFLPGDDATYNNGGHTCSALGFQRPAGGMMYRR